MSGKPKLIGVNHVALEVGNIDEALAFYGDLLEFELRGRVGDTMAFLDAGDQFLALSAPRRQPPDDTRHFGLVVDDKRALLEALASRGIETLPGRGLDFLDPWGNRVQVVEYAEIQFTKTEAVMASLGLADLGKTDDAEQELRERGF